MVQEIEHNTSLTPINALSGLNPLSFPRQCHPTPLSTALEFTLVDERTTVGNGDLPRIAQLVARALAKSVKLSRDKIYVEDLRSAERYEAQLKLQEFSKSVYIIMGFIAACDVVVKDNFPEVNLEKTGVYDLKVRKDVLNELDAKLLAARRIPNLAEEGRTSPTWSIGKLSRHWLFVHSLL
ncbi:hypothetical protein ACH5RR_021814 [Cinchona calisaya]|uniref:Uncharacterized protein n=1 Tax=Cinchona calisaya TaxID=153742 RepID=A0ABD2ZLY8_9GENT